MGGVVETVAKDARKWIKTTFSLVNQRQNLKHRAKRKPSISE